MPDTSKRVEIDHVREKLIELFFNANQLIHLPYMMNSEQAQRYIFEQMADHLIANGVTVQQWIPVTERLPQEDEPIGAICEQVQVLLSDGFVTTGWCNRGHRVWFYLPYGETRFVGNDYEKSPVIAWQPMAQPPKGD